MNISKLLGGEPLCTPEAVRIEVYLPCAETSLSHEYWVKAVARLLAQACGGATVTQGAGYWVPNAGGELCEEPVTVVMAYGSPAPFELTPLRKLLVQFGRETEQECVAFAVDGRLYGFNPKHVL